MHFRNALRVARGLRVSGSKAMAKRGITAEAAYVLAYAHNALASPETCVEGPQT